MIVLVLVVARLVFELADRTAPVVMGHMPVVVRMDYTRVIVLMFGISGDVLSRRCADCHEYLLSRALTRALRPADVAARRLALCRRGLALRTDDLASTLHAAPGAHRAQRR